MVIRNAGIHPDCSGLGDKTVRRIDFIVPKRPWVNRSSTLRKAIDLTFLGEWEDAT